MVTWRIGLGCGLVLVWAFCSDPNTGEEGMGEATGEPLLETQEPGTLTLRTETGWRSVLAWEVEVGWVVGSGEADREEVWGLLRETTGESGATPPPPTGKEASTKYTEFPRLSPASELDGEGPT